MWFAYIYFALQKTGMKQLGVFSKIRNYTGFWTFHCTVTLEPLRMCLEELQPWQDPD